MNRLTNDEEHNRLDQNDRLGIILVNFLSEEYLEDCLCSLLNQSYPITQIVIVNNGNQLPLPDLPKHASHIKIIDNQENVGFAKANNQAAGDDGDRPKRFSGGGGNSNSKRYLHRR